MSVAPGALYAGATSVYLRSTMSIEEQRKQKQASQALQKKQGLVPVNPDPSGDGRVKPDGTGQEYLAFDVHEQHLPDGGGNCMSSYLIERYRWKKEALSTLHASVGLAPGANERGIFEDAWNSAGDMANAAGDAIINAIIPQLEGFINSMFGVVHQTRQAKATPRAGCALRRASLSPP